MLLDVTHHLVGAQEIGQLFGVSRQRVYQLVTRPDFPEPMARLAMGNVWIASEVRQWAKQRGREIYE